MELYNFFTEIITEDEKISELTMCLEELKPHCLCVEIVKRKAYDGKYQYSIIGQIWGDDTNVGDTTLLTVFSDVKYTWFDAFCPQINNIKSDG